ncbi:MAG TPA: rhodanese-like domain-containing protein [Bacilli bacterium]|nr:rhodanese-like domain-containing protein [Bacilli bacterium]
MFNNIEISELKKIIGRVNIIDIRDNYIFKMGNIPTSKNIPMNFITTNPGEYLNNSITYYIYCEQGIRSVQVCKKLSSLGYKVINIIGGYQLYIKN